MGKALKWLVALAVVGGALWFLQARQGDQPVSRIEKPVAINDLK